MKIYIILLAFLALGITEMNAQRELTKKEARQYAKRVKEEKKEKAVVVKPTPVYVAPPEKTKVVTKKEVPKTITTVGFVGEFIGSDATFAINIAGDTFNLKVNKNMVFVSMSNRRILPFQGLDAIVYTIDSVSMDDMKWEKLMILDLSGMSDKEKEPYTHGVATTRDYVLFIDGSPKLKLLGDIEYGKL